MSHRPIRHKQAARIRKLLNRQPLPRHINLIEWLMDRGHAQTVGGARKLLTDGCVRTQGGNVLGREMAQIIEGEKVVSRYVPTPIIQATLRGEIVVIKGDT